MNNQTRSFAKYASLSVIGMIGLSCYILADTFFVAQGLGTNGLAALNLAIPIYSAITGMGMMTGMGAATCYSIMRSRGDEKADKVFTNALFIAAFFTLIFEICGIFFSGSISRLLGAEGDTYEMCRVYLRTLLIFSPFFLLNNISICFLRNDNAPHRSMAGMLAGSFSNIVLDYIFIFPFKMGMFGAVLATCFAPIISLGVMSGFYLKKRNTFHLTKTAPDMKLISRIAATGIPALVTELSSGIVIIVFNMIIMSLAGNVGVAAYGIAANIFIVVVSIYNGIAQGMQPLASKSSGEGDSAASHSYLRLALISGAVVSVMVYICIFFFADPIAGIFNSEKDPALQEIAIQGLRLYFIGCFFAGFNVIKAAYLSAVGISAPANLISILRGFAVIIPAALAMSALWGVDGLWLSFAASEFIVSIVSLCINPDRTRKAPSERP